MKASSLVSSRDVNSVAMMRRIRDGRMTNDTA